MTRMGEDFTTGEFVDDDLTVHLKELTKKGIPAPTMIIGDVAVYERGDEALLILLSRPVCSHRTADGDYVRHIRYYVTYRRESAKEYERLIEWLSWGFWWDSWCISIEPIIRQFLSDGCMSPQHFGDF